MDNLLSTIIFVLPGFMMYFWIQMMGVTPVVKHSTIEFGALSALAWFPVVFSSLGIMNTYLQKPIMTIQGVNAASSDLSFLLQFMAISVATSFFLSAIYVKFGYPLQLNVINAVRNIIGKAKLNKSPSVWEEVFNVNAPAVVGITKIGLNEPEMVGSLINFSRPFETRKAIKLEYVQYVTMVVKKYEVPVSEIYSDIESGNSIFIYDYGKYLEADEKERKEPEYIQTPLRSSTS
ncbi:hypothetical protein [Gorillibacterium timonense]|uniref:hypothetical protein n=1 Tax=Gorillibacterium timonense TaxID=1689269 RepID=UPI00071CC6C8|nr:hypothetical protein [Gorillibacterium timonense]